MGLNKYGYTRDEIKVFFNTPVTEHFRLNRNVNVITVVHNEVNRLVGYEIIQQRENFCIIKDISNSSIQEFDTILRRVFLLLKDSLDCFFFVVLDSNYC